MRCVLCMFLLTVLASVKCDGEENGTKLEYCPNVKNPIANIRKRRHLTFPDNSNLVITISLVKAFMTHAPSGWNTVLEMDVMFPLPDAKFTNKHARRKLHHRQKREVWERLRDALDLHNLNGRDCILRSICEAKEHLAPPGRSLVHDILREIFSAPIHDKDFQDEFADQYEEFSEPAYCDRVPDCPISLLHFILALNKQNY